MPTLNKKLLVRVLLVVFILAGALFAWHRVQAARAPEALLWQADAALEKGKTDKAIFFLRQYLEFRPDDHDTILRLADLILEKAVSPKDILHAHFLYERVLREAPERAGVARKLVALCMRMNRHGDALVHAQRLLQHAPNDGALLAQVAECQMIQNKPVEARASFEKAIAQNPDNVRAFELYARLLVRQFNKPAEARGVLDRLVQANPSSAEAFLVRARFLQNADQQDDCFRDLERVLALEPTNGEALVLSAEVLQGRGQLRAARSSLRSAIAHHPRYAYAYRALAWLETLSGNQADARATLEQGLEQVGDAPDLLMPLAELWIEQGDLQRVQGAIRKLEARKDAGIRARYLRGRVLMKQGQWRDALALLEALRADAVALPGLTPQLNLLLAGCHERCGQRPEQIEALRRALAADRTHLGARVALANAHLNSARFDEALKEYELAEKSPYAGLAVHVGSISLRISWLRATGGDSWSTVDRHIEALRRQYPHAVEPTMLAAEALAAQGQFTASAKLLRDEIGKRPGDARLWLALVNIISRSQGNLLAATALSEGQLAAGDTLEMRLARARLLAADVVANSPSPSARLDSLAATTNEAEHSTALAGLADIYENARNHAGLAHVYIAQAQLNSLDIHPRKELYRLALHGGNASEIAQWRQEIARLEGPDGRSCALLDALHSLSDAAAGKHQVEWHDLARSALSNNPDEPEAHLLLAMIAEKRGEQTIAARHFDTAVALQPLALRYRAAQLGHGLRTGSAEVKRFVTAIDGDPRFSAARLRAIVSEAVLLGRPETLPTCLSILQTHLAREPQSALWAGRMLEERGKISDALAIYCKINDRMPAFADAWSARLLAAARLGEVDLQSAMSAAIQALDKKTLFTVCAACGATLRMRVAAWTPPATTAAERRAYAEACVSTCEARGRLEDALPVLVALANDPGANPGDAAWARQATAALTAALGTPDQKHDAVRVLRSDPNNTLTEVQARQRLAALTVVFRSVGGNDRRAVARDMLDLYSTLTRGDTATSNDWFQLAQLHRVNGDRDAARKCLQELTRREPNNLHFVAVLVDDLLSDNAVAAARPWAERLANGCADVRVAGSAARFHALNDDAPAAISVIDRYVRIADPGTMDGFTRQRHAADLLDQATRLAAQRGLGAAQPLLDGACERYRASLRQFPDAIIPMTALQSHCHKTDAAFAELERHKSRHSAVTHVTAGVGILRNGPATAQQFQTVVDWTRQALTSTPGSPALLLNLGELHALQGDFAAAEAAYRDVLKAEPNNPVALNNLAWILAPRADTAAQAMKYAERAIELYGATPEMLDTRARILIAAGQYDRAVADLTDAINRGSSALRYFHLALAQLKQEKNDEATKTFREAKARGLDPRAIHPLDLPTFKVLADASVQ